MVVFSGEILHARGPITPCKFSPRFAVRLRGTSKKICEQIRDKNRNLSEPHYLGLQNG